MYSTRFSYLQDPRLNRTGGEYAAVVCSTQVPLSDRFNKFPTAASNSQENVVEQTAIVKKGFGRKLEMLGNGNNRRAVSDLLDNEEDDEMEMVQAQPMKVKQFSPFKGGIGRRHMKPPGLGGINKLAVLRASKDAEIMRLQAELADTQKLLIGGNVRGGIERRNGDRVRRTRIDDAGGISKGNLGNKMGRRRNEPFRTGRNGNRGWNRKNDDGKFFGSPKSKEELDNELDNYMLKSKSGKSTIRTSLDDELDEYMAAAARAKAEAQTIDKTIENSSGLGSVVNSLPLNMMNLMEQKNSDDGVVEDMEI